MHPLWVLETHLRVLVCLVDTLWLAVEDDLLKLGGVDCLDGLCRYVLVLEAELQDTLLTCDPSSVISVLLQLRQ